MLMVEDTSSFGKAVIRELLVLVCLLLRDGLTSVVNVVRVNVVRVNERIMYVKLVIGKQIVNIVSAYAPQVLKRRMTSGTALSLCSLEFLSKKAFSLVAT